MIRVYVSKGGGLTVLVGEGDEPGRDIEREEAVRIAREVLSFDGAASELKPEGIQLALVWRAVTDTDFGHGLGGPRDSDKVWLTSAAAVAGGEEIASERASRPGVISSKHVGVYPVLVVLIPANMFAGMTHPPERLPCNGYVVQELKTGYLLDLAGVEREDPPFFFQLPPRVVKVRDLFAAEDRGERVDEVVAAAKDWAVLYRDLGHPGDSPGGYTEARIRLNQAVRELERFEGVAGVMKGPPRP